MIMRRLLWVLAVIPALALGQGVQPSTWTMQGPLPLIQADANTKLHVVWNGSRLVDLAGSGWEMNGTVPQTFYRRGWGFWYPVLGGANTFSGSNYYKLGAASDAADTNGDRYACAVFIPTSTATQVIYSNGIPNTSGNAVYIFTAGILRQESNVAANRAIGTVNSVNTNAVNVGCWGRTGTSIIVKLNGGSAAANGSAGTEVSGTGAVAKIGLYEGGTLPFLGTILEVIVNVGSPPGSLTFEQWAAVVYADVCRKIAHNPAPVRCQ